MRMIFVALSLLALTGNSVAGVAHEAHADRVGQPKALYNYCYYLTTDAVPGVARERTIRVATFALASLSRNTQLDLIAPVEVRPGLYRLNTQNLGWDTQWPNILRKHYPYNSAAGELPLVIRADWLIQFALDQRRSGDTYFRLLFGQPITNVKELYQQLDVQIGSDFDFGWIENDSGVANNKVRVIVTTPTRRRSDLWQTFDYEEIDSTSDPLEHLTRGIGDANHGHDASEIIFGLPKSIPGQAGTTGQLQGYALANGQGVIQQVAPANIVTDSIGVRGPEIVNAYSCMICHTTGLNQPSTNALRQYVASGAQAFINDYTAQQLVDRFYLTDLSKFLTRSNVDYATAIQATSGYTPPENAQALAETIRLYDQPLTLGDAARELYVAPAELRNALGWWSAAGKTMPARLAVLAHGGTIPRTSWESEYRFALQLLQTWRVSR